MTKRCARSHSQTDIKFTLSAKWMHLHYYKKITYLIIKVKEFKKNPDTSASAQVAAVLLNM